MCGHEGLNIAPSCPVWPGRGKLGGGGEGGERRFDTSRLKAMELRESGGGVLRF